MFSCYDLKLKAFNVGMKLMLAVILAVNITESDNNKQTKQAQISLKTKINSNKGKPHLKISDTLLTFYLWTKY